MYYNKTAWSPLLRFKHSRVFPENCRWKLNDGFKAVHLYQSRNYFRLHFQLPCNQISNFVKFYSLSSITPMVWIWINPWRYLGWNRLLLRFPIIPLLFLHLIYMYQLNHQSSMIFGHPLSTDMALRAILLVIEMEQNECWAVPKVFHNYTCVFACDS